MITKNETTVSVNGVTEIQFRQTYGYFSVRNDSSGMLYASVLVPECTAGSDGVISIPAGGSCVINSYGGNKLWLSGSGSAMVIGQWDKINPFKAAAKGGDNTVKTGIAEIYGINSDYTIGEITNLEE